MCDSVPSAFAVIVFKPPAPITGASDVTHEGKNNDQLVDFNSSLYSVDTRLHMMYEKAKVDRTIRTDIPEAEFMRVTVHSMMTACAHYAEGFIWGSDDNKDYTDELIMIKEMILDYATKGIM